MKGIFRKWWLWGLAVLLVAAAGVTYWLWPTKYKLTVSPETTVLLGPLNPDGTVNYVAALNQMYGEGVTPENNAAVLLIRAAGPEMLPEPARARVLKRLGMDPLPKRGDYFIPLYSFVSRHYAGEALPFERQLEMQDQALKDLPRARTAPWSAGEYPVIRDWLKANAKPLSLVIAASRRPRYHSPLISNTSPPTLYSTLGLNLRLTLCRPMAKALGARAMLNAGEGRIEDAISDLLAAHRLARLVGQDPMPMGRLFGLAIEANACESSSGLAISGKLTHAQARGFLARLKVLPPVPDIVEPMDKLERFWDLDGVALLIRESWTPGATGSDGEYVRQAVGEVEIDPDWDNVLRKVNYWIDLQVAAMRKEPYSERREAIASCTDAFRTYSSNAKGNAETDWLTEALSGRTDTTWNDVDRRDPVRAVVSRITSMLTRVRFIHDKRAMNFRLAQVAVGLAACKAEKGGYPAKLAELAPEYFKKLPQDLFAEGLLTYRRVGKGYLLYSVGENQRDDGGRNNEREKDRKEKFDDIAVRAE